MGQTHTHTHTHTHTAESEVSFALFISALFLYSAQ